MLETYAKKADGFVFAYSLTEKSTFVAMKPLAEKILKAKEKDTHSEWAAVLIGTKSDLKDKHQVRIFALRAHLFMNISTENYIYLDLIYIYIYFLSLSLKCRISRSGNFQFFTSPFCPYQRFFRLSS